MSACMQRDLCLGTTVVLVLEKVGRAGDRLVRVDTRVERAAQPCQRRHKRRARLQAWAAIQTVIERQKVGPGTCESRAAVRACCILAQRQQGDVLFFTLAKRCRSGAAIQCSKPRMGGCEANASRFAAGSRRRRIDLTSRALYAHILTQRKTRCTIFDKFEIARKKTIQCPCLTGMGWPRMKGIVWGSEACCADRSKVVSES